MGRDTTESSLRSKLDALHDRRAAALSSSVAAERAAALDAMRADVEQASAAEAERLRRALALREQAAEAAMARAEAAALVARTTAATEILAGIFADGANGLPALVREFRREPSRAIAAKIREQWAAFDERARRELGEPLGVQVFGALLVDDILAQPEFAAGGGINYLSSFSFGPTEAGRSALDAALRATSAADFTRAFEVAESVMLAVVNQARGQTPDPRHAELHALRRSCATDRDYSIARGELERTHAAAALAEWRSEYVPPPTLGEAVRQHAIRLFS